MNINRRNFLIGGASAFGALGAFGGNRFFAASGLKDRGRPKLRFGVISDTHVQYVGADRKIEEWFNYLTLKHTLEYFREQNVDAVVIAGDLTDYGTITELTAVSEAWYSVFPDDKYPDGRPVTKVFVTGNHDWEGYLYGKYGEKKYPDPAERARNLFQHNLLDFWEKLFHEPYEPIYSKSVNGYTFIGAHWDTGGFGNEKGRKAYPFRRIKGWMEQNSKKINPALPFFYVQHPHPKDTCYGSWAWGHDGGITTKTLSAFPNAIAFSGHSHYSLTDERSVWQGGFTSVGTSSLRYTGRIYNELPGAGYENSGVASAKNWRDDAEKMLPPMPSLGNCRQGMLWSVYDDCITVKRREFLSNLDVGDDWVLPLPAAEPRPFAFAERAKKREAPRFPDGAKIKVTVCKRKNRGGKSKDGKEIVPSEVKNAFAVEVPPVVLDVKSRLYSLEFTMQTPDGKKQVKRILAKGYNHSVEHPEAKSAQTCVFVKDCPDDAAVKFTVTPMNCFGERGRELTLTCSATPSV